MPGYPHYRVSVVALRPLSVPGASGLSPSCPRRKRSATASTRRATHFAFLRFARRLPFFLATFGAAFFGALRAVLERVFFAAIFLMPPFGGAGYEPDP